eukprot:COSAG01_NODE_2920_length_6825_cov_27.601452_2_plen_195_part_00
MLLPPWPPDAVMLPPGGRLPAAGGWWLPGGCLPGLAAGWLWLALAAGQHSRQTGAQQHSRQLGAGSDIPRYPGRKAGAMLSRHMTSIRSSSSPPRPKRQPVAEGEQARLASRGNKSRWPWVAAWLPDGAPGQPAAGMHGCTATTAHAQCSAWVALGPHQPRLDRFSRSPANLLDSLHAGSQQRISDSLPPRPVG